MQEVFDIASSAEAFKIPTIAMQLYALVLHSFQDSSVKTGRRHCIKIPEEFVAIRHALYLGTSWEKALKDATWCLLNRKYGDVYPNLFALMDLVLTLPASTAECERGFSAMKVVKSNQRSSLNSDTV